MRTLVIHHGYYDDFLVIENCRIPLMGALAVGALSMSVDAIVVAAREPLSLAMAAAALLLWVLLTVVVSRFRFTGIESNGRHYAGGGTYWPEVVERLTAIRGPLESMASDSLVVALGEYRRSAGATDRRKDLGQKWADVAMDMQVENDRLILAGDGTSGADRVAFVLAGLKELA